MKVCPTFASKFTEIWQQKLAAIVKGKKSQASLAEESKALDELFRPTLKSTRGKHGSVDKQIKELEDELAQVSEDRGILVEKLVSNMSSAPSNFSKEFTITKIGTSKGAETSLDYVHNIETKKLYLKMELIRLEKAQIAESIMQVESIPGTQSRFIVTFDSNILNQKMDMDIQELSSLNKLREYSLFGIHRTMPNSPIPCFSYFKDFHVLCKDPLFKFEDTMPYNQDPLKYIQLQSGKKQTKHQSPSCEELQMCHHCKVLLPSESIFTCSKKFKCLQSDPCNEYLTQGISFASVSWAAK